MTAPHPGFGIFLKAHREFHDACGPDGWCEVPGYRGVAEKTLSGRFDHARRRGCVTRLARWQAGAAVDDVLSHDWCEEVFVISGTLWLGRPDRRDVAVRLGAGSYACRPAHIDHGPFFSPDGCLLIEFLYYAVEPLEAAAEHPDLSSTQ